MESTPEQSSETNPKPSGQRSYRRALLPIIDRRFQFKLTLLIVSIVTVSHLTMGLYLYQNISEFAQKLAAFVPDLQPDVEYFQRSMLTYMIVTVVSTFAAIVAVSIYFSARISGPLFNISRVLEKFAQGDTARRVVLRKNDELQEFADATNRFLETMEKKLK